MMQKVTDSNPQQASQLLKNSLVAQQYNGNFVESRNLKAGEGQGYGSCFKCSVQDKVGL